MPEAKVRLRRCLLKACEPARISIEPVLITFYSPGCETLCIIINYKLAWDPLSPVSTSSPNFILSLYWTITPLLTVGSRDYDCTD